MSGLKSRVWLRVSLKCQAIRSLLGALIVVLLVFPAARAQVQTGRISGVDGLYNQAIYNKDSGLAGAPSETGGTTVIPLDAVQEVVPVANPKAEYGWDPGLTMSAALKSGHPRKCFCLRSR